MSGGEVRRVVIDSNIFVSGLISKRGTPHAIMAAWQAGEFLLLMAADQRAELQDVLSRPQLVERFRLAAAEIQAVFDLIEATAHRAPLQDPLPVRGAIPRTITSWPPPLVGRRPISSAATTTYSPWRAMRAFEESKS